MGFSDRSTFAAGILYTDFSAQPQFTVTENPDPVARILGIIASNGSTSKDAILRFQTAEPEPLRLFDLFVARRSTLQLTIPFLSARGLVLSDESVLQDELSVTVFFNSEEPIPPIIPVF